ncbi:hypothetical protein [Glycomyces rhizosphaerae]|uniref:Uncharacterized protein n=1 Tax=Glycomyces rhizosphaerae TaxID=2054422 RepID=A0ABV7PZ16_9ACTN
MTLHLAGPARSSQVGCGFGEWARVFGTRAVEDEGEEGLVSLLALRKSEGSSNDRVVLGTHIVVRGSTAPQRRR